MKYLFVLISILAITCNKENSQSEFNSSGSIEQAQASNIAQESTFGNLHGSIQKDTLLDSTAWKINKQNLEPASDMLFVNSRWQIISQKQFEDSIIAGHYGSVFLTDRYGRTASRLKYLSREFKNHIDDEFFDEAISNSQKSVLHKYFNTECPDFSFTDLKGNVITKASLKGKVAVLNFWFLNCKGCRHEIPDLNDLVDQYKGNNDVVFVAPSTDSQEKLITHFLTQEFKYTQNKFNYTVATINYFKESERAPLIFAYPTHIIVNQEGKMTFLYIGGTSIKKILDQEIKKLLI